MIKNYVVEENLPPVKVKRKELPVVIKEDKEFFEVIFEAQKNIIPGEEAI